MSRRAFTLVELSVAIAVIAVLLALLLPVVHQVRASAARTECVNNLRQIGLALANYHGTNKCFPPGYSNAGNGTSPGWGWAAYILPEMEKADLYNAIQFASPIEAS